MTKRVKAEGKGFTRAEARRFAIIAEREARFCEAFNVLLEDKNMEMFSGDEFQPAPAIATVKADFDVFRYPMFKKDQPAIGNYAQSSPENMAKLLIFVVCSQQTEWPRLNVLFPPFWAYLVAHDGIMSHYAPPDDNEFSLSAPTQKTDLSSGQSWWKGRSKEIDFIWKHRVELYNGLMRAVEADAKNGDTGFLVYRKMILVPGLGVPKAGFAVQLLIGKMGCIDSVNLNVLGVNSPKHIMSPSGGFKNASGIQNPSQFSGIDNKNLAHFLYGELNKKSYEVLRGYSDYLADLESKGTSSETLWNVWCSIIAHKIHYFGDKPIDVQLPNQTDTSRVWSYKGSSASHLAKAQAKLNPWNPPEAASSVSKDHADLITGESAMNDVNRMVEKILESPQDGDDFLHAYSDDDQALSNCCGAHPYGEVIDRMGMCSQCKEHAEFLTNAEMEAEDQKSVGCFNAGESHDQRVERILSENWEDEEYDRMSAGEKSVPFTGSAIKGGGGGRSKKTGIPNRCERLQQCLDAFERDLLEKDVVLNDDLREPFQYGGIPYGQVKTANYRIATIKGRPTRKYYHVVITRMEDGSYEPIGYVL